MYNSYVNFDLDWSYPLQWLYESEPARWSYQRWIWRSSLAKQGKPCRNTYQENLLSNIKKTTPEVQAKYTKECYNVPCGESFALRKAIDNVASQMAGGVDSYDYRINDQFMTIDADTEALLSAKCEQDYIENRFQRLAPVFSNDLMWFGVAACIIKYDPVTDKNKALRINPKNIWFDTRYSSTGEERFRGYSTMISWAKLKKMIEHDGDVVNLDIKAPAEVSFHEEGEGRDKHFVIDKKATFSNRKIRSLNGLDIYVESMNKLAASTSLAGGIDELKEYDHDLVTCYNLGWYRSFATDPEKRTKNGYNGDDVELTVLYDLDRKIEFKIINRRYVISMNQRAFRRKIKFEWTNPMNGTRQSRIDDFCLDCPLKFQYESLNDMDTAPHPWSIVFSLLDTHDELCGWLARREHVSKILSILRIDTNGADAESLRNVLNIMGGMADDLQGDVQSIILNYDYNPIDSEITRLQNRIQQVLHAYDQFDALQSMGDRASAAESGMAMNAIAQGLVVHQDALLAMFADMARQCIANRVAYSPRQEFQVVNNGNFRAITVQQMALSAIINVKPKLAKQIEQKQTAANAMAMLGTMGQEMSKELKAYLMVEALYGTMPRKMAEEYLLDKGPSEQELAIAAQQGKNDAMALQQNQQMYEQNPIPYEVDNVMANNSPEEIDFMIGELSAGSNSLPDSTPTGSNAGQTNLNVLDMEQQPGAMAMSGLEGMTPELGSQLANPNGF